MPGGRPSAENGTGVEGKAEGSDPAALSGISFGLSLYFYPSGKLVFLLLPVVSAYLLLAGRRRFARGLGSKLAVLFLAFFLTFLPYAVTSFRDGWGAFVARYQERSIFTPRNRPEGRRATCGKR